MSIRVEGFAIVSEDGMLADASGVMPSALVVEADQHFLSDALDRIDLIVHGRNSHENQAHSPQRRRLIATRQIKTVAPAENFSHALFWNPAGLPFENAAEMLGIRNGTVAIWRYGDLRPFSAPVGFVSPLAAVEVSLASRAPGFSPSAKMEA
jgi:hypothetical protein